MDDDIKVTIKKFYKNGLSSEETSTAGIKKDSSIKMEEKEISSEELINGISKKIMTYIKLNHSKALTSGKFYYNPPMQIGHGITIGHIFKIRYNPIDDINDYTIELIIHEDYISVTEESKLMLPSGKTVMVSESYYMTHFSAYEFSYAPREVDVKINNGNSKSFSLSTNFEGGWSHSFADLDSNTGMNCARYVGSNNEDPIVYTDIEEMYDDKNRLIVRMTRNGILKEDIDPNTVISKMESYKYEEEEKK